MASQVLTDGDDKEATAINLTGNEQGQTILGNTGVNVISAGDGTDKLFGYGGKDDIRGGWAPTLSPSGRSARAPRRATT